MKKLIFLGSAIIAALMFNSCDETIESSPLSVDNSKSATLKCFFYADTDLTKPGEEAVPAGTKVTFRYDYSELEYAGSGSTKGSWTQTASVNDSGYVMITVPVDDDGVNLEISPASFEFDQKQASGSSVSTISKTFTLANQNVNVASGDIKVYDYTYTTDATLETPQLDATITGYVYAELDNTSSGNEFAPSGTKVKVYSDDFEVFVEVDGSGMFSASVKVNKDGDDFTVEALSFTYDQVQPLTSDVTTKKMQYAKTTGSVSDLMAGETKSLKLTYTSTTDVSPDPSATMIPIGGSIEADINTETAELETFNAGTTFTFYTNSWSKNVSVDATGDYTVNVPENENVKFSCDFEIDRRVEDLPSNPGTYITKTYRCKVDGQVVGSYDYENGGVDLAISNFSFTEVNPVN